MAEEVRLICDSCRTAENVGKYRLCTPKTGLNRAIALDLCDECAKPIQVLEGLGRPVVKATRAYPKYRPGRGGATVRARIYSQEELDALEAEQNS